MRRSRWLFCAVLLGAGACVVQIDDDAVDRPGQAIRSVGAEVNLHSQIIMDADTVSAVRIEVMRHRSMMYTLLAEVEDRLEDDGCHDGMSSMRGHLDDARARVDAYAAQMDAFTTLPELRQACDAYGAEMDDRARDMMSHWHEMWCPIVVRAAGP